MSRMDLRRRVAALNTAINPARSLTARLAKLSDEQRDEYGRWRERCNCYYAANSCGSAYERLISGEQPPPLRRDVRRALFGTAPIITEEMSVADAADAYQQYTKGM